jgi:hypothetical protein
MKQVSALMRWVGPVAIVGATFAVISDQLGLVVHLPEVGADTMGYHAVGSGLFLFVLTLLLVGMIGLYSGRGDSSGAKVIEYGDRHARCVLVDDDEEMERTLAPYVFDPDGNNVEAVHHAVTPGNHPNPD